VEDGLTLTYYFFGGVATSLLVALVAGVALWLPIRRAVAEGRRRLDGQAAATRQGGTPFVPGADAILRRLEDIERRLAELEKRQTR
jgi:hypothetical protein